MYIQITTFFGFIRLRRKDILGGIGGGGSSRLDEVCTFKKVLVEISRREGSRGRQKKNSYTYSGTSTLTCCLNSDRLNFGEIFISTGRANVFNFAEAFFIFYHLLPSHVQNILKQTILDSNNGRFLFFFFWGGEGVYFKYLKNFLVEAPRG